MIELTSRAALALAAALWAAAAFAQQPITPAPTTAAPVAPASTSPVPKHSCVHPGEFPGRLASERQQKQWQKDFVAYVDCLRKFVTDQQALAQPHVQAANATVEEYNKAVAEYNDTIQKLKEE
ncbi:MAG TPA: hypothetical protein VF925_05925 [Casimicrobiaceae bacterium]|jgi:hypothetical protein